MTTTSSRLLTLLSLLQSRRDWPGTVLAERLAISDRTVRRDVDRLREMGYSIHSTMGPDGGYRLDAGTELPPLLFDDDQVVALAVALQAATATGAGIEEAALRALTTVRQVMPSRLRHRLDALQFSSAARPGDGPAVRVAPEVLMTISTAIHAREILRFDYESRDPDAAGTFSAPRRTEPHHLVTTQGRWYLVAWDLEHDGWRTFRADRIIPRTPTGPRFTPREVPGGDAQGYIEARFKGAAPGNGWPCTATVILHRPATEVLPFAGDGTVEPLGPDSCRYTVGSWSWIALAATLGRFDTAIEVVEPAELTEAFGELANRYGETANRR